MGNAEECRATPRARRTSLELAAGGLALLLFGAGCDGIDLEAWTSGSRLAELFGSATPDASDEGATANGGEGGLSLGPEDATRMYYQFIDAKGAVRFVERLDDVPEAWRDRVGFVEMSVPPPLTPGDASASRVARAKRRNLVPLPGGSQQAATDAGPVLFYTASWCGWCRKARSHMEDEGIVYEARDIDTPSAKAELIRKTGRSGVPAFDVDGRIITGYDPQRLEQLVASR